jgi:hypothetical protein
MRSLTAAALALVLNLQAAPPQKTAPDCPGIDPQLCDPPPAPADPAMASDARLHRVPGS